MPEPQSTPCEFPDDGHPRHTVTVDIPDDWLYEAALESDELRDELTSLAANIHAATYRLVALAVLFDLRREWAAEGMCSCAHWLNWTCGIGLHAAREKLRVGHALLGLPRLRAAFAAGEISYSKARAITRVAHPDNEDYLLMIARHGTASHVERLVRAYRWAVAAAETEHAKRQQEMRALEWRIDFDGMLCITCRLAPVAGARVIKALEAAMDDDDTAPKKADSQQHQQHPDVPAGTSGQPQAASEPEPEPTKPEADRPEETWDGSPYNLPPPYNIKDPPPGSMAAHLIVAARAVRGEFFNPVWEAPYEPFADTDTPVEARRADALTRIADAYIDHRRPTRAAADRYQVVVHVDAEVLADPACPGRCDVEGRNPLPTATARRVACDASVVRIGGKSESLDVGRRTRTVPPAIRRALEARDNGCRFPGCAHQRFVEAHHIEHWANGGATKLSNLVTLCSHHHTLIHEGGYTVEPTDTGDLRFFTPDGAPIPDDPPDLEVTASLKTHNRDRGHDINARTCRPNWSGERMDMGLAVANMMQHTHRS